MKMKSAHPVSGWDGVRDQSDLERYSWRNWILLSAIAIISTMGLVFTVPPLITENTIELWPWAPTDMVLLCGLVLSVTVFVLHLTQQQRNVVKMRGDMRTLEHDAVTAAEKNTNRLYALLNVSRIMSTMTDLQEVFDTITRLSADAFTCDRASLMLFDEKTRELVVRSTNEGENSPILNKRQKIGDGIAGWVAKNRKPLMLSGDDDFAKHTGLKPSDSKISSAMVVPILVRDELVGILNISSRQAGGRYDEIDLKALEVFAANAGACIRHSEQAAWMRKTIQNLQHASMSRN